MNCSGWIASNYSTMRNIAGHYRTSTHNCLFANHHSRHQKGAGTDEGIGADVDRFGLQWPVGIVKIVAACTEVSLLGHTGTCMDLHRPEAVRVGAITKTGPVVQGEIPRVLNSGPLMNERSAVDCSTEASQNK